MQEIVRVFSGGNDPPEFWSTSASVPNPAHSRRLIEIAAVAICYVLVGELELVFGRPGAILVLPPAGIALAAPLILGFRVWPGVFVGALFHGYFRALADPAAVLGIAAANTVEGMVGAWLVMRFANGRRFHRSPKDIVRFALLGGLLSPWLAPPFGLPGISLSHFAFWRQDPGTLLAWWLGEMLSVLVLVPFLVLLMETPIRRPSRAQVAEFSLLLLLLFGMSAAVFSDLLPAWAHGYLVQYLCLPFPIWAAHRFGSRATALTIFCQGAVALLAFLAGHSLFGLELPDRNLLAYQGFTSLSSVLGLVVAAATTQRKKAQEALRLACDELDIKVEERTFELQDEIQRRKATEAELARDIIERKQAQAQLRETLDKLDARVRERTAELTLANHRLETEMERRTLAETGLSHALESLIEARETERKRLSHELHDEVGQKLTALKLGLKMAQESEPIPRSVADGLNRVEVVADGIMQDLHRLAWELRPPALEQEDLTQALRRYTDQWSRASGVTLDFHSSLGARQRLPGVVETTLYRVAQEALTNVLRHARAKRVGVILNRFGKGVSLIVEDDGVGFEPGPADGLPSHKGSIGILGMRERVETAGGSIDIESGAGTGTTVYVRIPLNFCKTERVAL